MLIKIKFTIKNAETATALVLSAIIVFLLVFRTIHAGGLWRDECGAVQLALMPTFSDIARNFEYESFPFLFPALLRMYAVVFGTSDAAFRFFGFFVGVMLILMLWYNARAARCGPPLLSLVLIGLNSDMLLTATTIRGYGLGCVFVLLLFGLLRTTLDKVGPLRLTAVLLVSLASLHCLLFNTVMLAAIAGASVIELFLLRKYRPASALALIAVLSLLSMAVYYHPYLHRLEWNMLLKAPLNLHMMWAGMNNALGEPPFFTVTLFHALFITVLGGALWKMYITRRRRSGSYSSVLRFYLLAALFSLVGYVFFLKLLDLVLKPWYFVPFFSIVAVAVDVLAGKLAVNTGLRMVRLGLVFLSLIIIPAAAGRQILERQTDIDRMARVLDLNVNNGDLIVINPWFFGITFNWYYRGAAPWVTVPAIDDHRTNRYDLLKEKMMLEHPLDDLYALMEKTLQGNHRVWLAGDVSLPSDSTIPPSLPPAPNSPFGWRNWVYTDMWTRQVCLFLDRHSVQRVGIGIPVKNGVSELENASLLMAEGWK